MAEDTGTGGGWLPPRAAGTTFTGPAGQTVNPYAVPDSAGWWARVGATIIDSLLVFAASFVIGLIVSPAGGSEVAVNVISAAAFVSYAPLMLAFHGGRTWGKQACGIRVINMSGEPIGFGRALLREVPVKLILGIVPLIDVLWPLWQKDNRALHDLVVGTRVVDG
jgi:uncharacterized RDD family membrane protein YckC